MELHEEESTFSGEIPLERVVIAPDAQVKSEFLYNEVMIGAMHIKLAYYRDHVRGNHLSSEVLDKEVEIKASQASEVLEQTPLFGDLLPALDPGVRRIAVLKYLYQLNAQNIAHILQCEPVTVNDTIHRLIRARTSELPWTKDDLLLRTKEVAKVLGIGERSVCSWAAKGIIPSRKIAGRGAGHFVFRAADIYQVYHDKQKQNAQMKSLSYS